MARPRAFVTILAVFSIVTLVIASSASAHTAARGNHTRTTQQGDNGQSFYDPQPVHVGELARSEQLPVNTTGVSPLVGAAATSNYGIGDIRRYVVYDAIAGKAQPSDYVVRYKSEQVEVWVQKDLSYQSADGTPNPIHPDAQDPQKVTQERVDILAAAAEKIIPVDVEYFGQYKDRSGANASLLAPFGLPDNYYAGPPQSVVIVISNVRDANFFDPINNPTYIAGFFGPAWSNFADRNIITIDSKRFDINTSAPSFQNEATIAHEFQHLINADTDPDGEDTWANEGRSELAEFINGYRPTPEDHRTQFSDYPENSLTLWGDQDHDPDQNYEILADYQQSYWFQLYLAGRLKEAGIGTANNQYIKLVSQLTSDLKNSIASINAMLVSVNAPFTFEQVWSEFRTAMLFGGTSDETTWGSYISTWQGHSAVPVAPLDLGRLRRNLNFEGYDLPGAPPYGSEYIEIGWSSAIKIDTTVTFNGSDEHTFKLDFVTFADKNGKQVSKVSSVNLDANSDATFQLGSLLNESGFNEAGERVIAVVSAVPSETNLVSAPLGYAPYRLTGLPPSIYTSRARAIGTASNTSLIRPRVFPGDTFKMMVTVDNLGRNADVQTSVASPAYVAVPLPPYTTVTPNSFTSTVSPDNFQVVDNLSTLSSGLPAGPGVYWFGTVENTAELAFELAVAAPLLINTEILPTAHIANAPFNQNPSQRFTDLQAPAQVVSPFALSTVVAQPEVRLGGVARFTYTLINTDDQTRDVDMRYILPEKTKIERINIKQQGSTTVTPQAMSPTTMSIRVPSYQATKTVMVVTIDVKVEAGFVGKLLDLQAVLLQPNTELPYNAGPLSGTTVTTNVTGYVYLPLVHQSHTTQAGLLQQRLVPAN